MQPIQRITPCLWFDDQAEEAVEFYAGIFRNSQIIDIARYGEAGHDVHRKPAGTVMTVAFELDGQAFTALNGGPMFKFTEAISFQVTCERILKGAKPADVPVELPSRVELVVNLKAAKALGVTVPRTALLRADQAIE